MFCVPFSLAPGNFTDPEGVGMEDLALRTRKQENCPRPLFIYARVELALLVRTRESWQADQPCNYSGPEPGLWVGPPQYPPHLGSAGAHEGTSFADPKLQNLHDIGQQQDVQEELK